MMLFRGKGLLSIASKSAAMRCQSERGFYMPSIKKFGQKIVAVASAAALVMVFSVPAAFALNKPEITSSQKTYSLNYKAQTAKFNQVNNKKWKKVTVPTTLTFKDNKGKKFTYKVTEIAKGSFNKSKATKVIVGKNIKDINDYAFKGAKAKRATIIVKSKNLTSKASVKKCFKGSKFKKVTVKVDLGSKSLNKKYVKKYKKVFTKSNTGVKCSVKRA